jgi:hypothetical protein
LRKVIRLLPPTPLNGLADQYGQFTRADWPGKIHQDAVFQKQDTEEGQWLAYRPPLGTTVIWN